MSFFFATTGIIILDFIHSLVRFTNILYCETETIYQIPNTSVAKLGMQLCDAHCTFLKIFVF